MGKLLTFSGKQVCQILEQYGFVEVRRKGSHIAMQRKEKERTITVPVPDHKEIRVGTLLSIMRQSGLPRSAFE